MALDLDAPNIVIVDVDAGIPLAERQAVAAALQIQVRRDFAPLWGVGDNCTVTVAVPGGVISPTAWQMQLRKVPTIQGALGYHDRTSTGYPILYIFPELCAQDGTNWSSCASHEVLEALADPELRCCEQLTDGLIAAREVCDQVEALTYLINGVAVSDFNTVDNFAPPSTGAKYDFLGKQAAPFQNLSGGYSQVYDSSTGWQQIMADKISGYRQKMAELGLSRGVRRALKRPAKKSLIKRVLSVLKFW